MTIDQLIAETLSGGFQKYDEQGLIDEISLRRWIRIEMRRFGNNIMLSSDKILTVNNGKAKLPDNFWKLELAYLCSPLCYEVEEGDEKLVQEQLFYKERVEGEVEWDNMSNSWQWDKYRVVKEQVYMKGCKVNFYYQNPTPLRITKTFNKTHCTEGFKRLQRRLTNSGLKEINILGETLQTNFKKGYIYIQYKGLPEADGEIYIPETQHNRLQEYLITHCRRRILEDAYIGDEEANVARKLELYIAKESVAFDLAMTEAKMSGLGHDWSRKIVRKTREDSLKYQIMFPSI